MNQKTPKETISNFTDEELAQEIIDSRDTIAFGILYDRYEKMVYNKCYQFVSNTEEAKDLAHDVFLQVFIKINTFKGTAKFSSWLYSVCYNFCVNYLNRNKEKKISSQSNDIDQEYGLSQEEISDETLLELKVEKLKKALVLIPPEDKMILQMKYQDDISIKELQLVLEISESAVKMRLARAKEKLITIYNKIDH